MISLWREGSNFWIHYHAFKLFHACVAMIKMCFNSYKEPPLSLRSDDTSTIFSKQKLRIQLCTCSLVWDLLSWTQTFFFFFGAKQCVQSEGILLENVILTREKYLAEEVLWRRKVTEAEACVSHSILKIILLPHRCLRFTKQLSHRIHRQTRRNKLRTNILLRRAEPTKETVEL